MPRHIVLLLIRELLLGPGDSHIQQMRIVRELFNLIIHG